MAKNVPAASSREKVEAQHDLPAFGGGGA